MFYAIFCKREVKQKKHRYILNTSYFITREWSKARVSPLPPSSSPSLCPLLTDSGSFPTRVPGTPCSPRRISMGEETKARGNAEGSATTKKIEEKKGTEMAPHVQRVFGASPSAVGKLLFSAPSVSLVPARFWFSLVPCGPYLSFSFFSPGILARSAPSRNRLFYFLTPSLFFKLTPGPSISSLTVSQYLKE